MPVVVLFSQSYPPSQGRLELANPRLFSVISLSAAVSSILSLNVSYRNTEDVRAEELNRGFKFFILLSRILLSVLFPVGAVEPVLWAVRVSREKTRSPAECFFVSSILTEDAFLDIVSLNRFVIFHKSHLL